MNCKILIIEDDQDIINGLKLNLTAEGYSVDSSLDGDEGVEKASTALYDLILLDIMLPGIDGLEVCRRLRQNGVIIPIIMLTAKGEEIDKIVGLEIGADDYITKPFSVRELLARIKAHLRRHRNVSQDEMIKYTLGTAEIDFSKFTVRTENRQEKLTSLEVDILKYLIARKGEVIHRNDLLNKVWGYDSYPTTRTVDNHIMKLRKKIETDPARPEIILSVYGTGYRLMG